MRNQPYTPPTYQRDAFHCPYCLAYAKQRWSGIYLKDLAEHLGNSMMAICSHCSEITIWVSGQLVYPDATGIAPPNPDLPETIQADYKEAANIVNRSPRGAAALLRLCIQKLCQQLGEPGRNINDDIASLVKKGLNSKIQKALDVVRVVGNNAVHPGELDLKDDKETAVQLFRLINLIAEKMITEPKEIDGVYDALVPESAKDQIKKRDGN
jgi:hypothetical protein